MKYTLIFERKEKYLEEIPNPYKFIPTLIIMNLVRRIKYFRIGSIFIANDNK